jgi:Flp pilus assembly CpaF family ATPase
LETADALLRVVNTGHRVINTLHANSAAMVPTRFLQLGVQAFFDRLDAPDGPLAVSAQNGLPALRRGSADTKP